MALKSLLPWRRGELARGRDPFVDLQREMNNLIERFFSDSQTGAWPAGAFAPEVDISENDKEVRISAELPGVDEKDLEVSVTEDSISIRGEKKEEKEEKNGERRYVERSYGSFQRRLPLPSEVDASKAKATFKKGVLTITVPKSASVQKARKISITT
jgi:HSP20 family protein